MSKFFKTEDITQILNTAGSNQYAMDFDNAVCKLLNEQLEHEGKVVFSQSSDRRYWTDPNDPTTQGVHLESDLQALLINISPIVEDKPKPTYEELEKEVFVLKTKIEMNKAEKLMISNMSCTHPNEKVKEIQERVVSVRDIYLSAFYMCECGARVKPTSFEVVE